MGNCVNKETSELAVLVVTDRKALAEPSKEKNFTPHSIDAKTEPPQDGQGQITTKPSPQVFAIMRNGHEVIRGNVLEIQSHLDKGEEGLDDAVEMFMRLQKWSHLHMLMEEGNPSSTDTADTDDVDDSVTDGEANHHKTPKGFFAILDLSFDNIATKEGLRTSHIDLEHAEDQMKKAIQTEDLETIQAAFKKFITINEDHLQKEEAVMMPKVKAMKENGVNMKQLMVQELLAVVVDLPDFQFFVQHANFILDRHSGNMPKARVFDHALWACATAEQWKVWQTWIRGSVSNERYKEIMAAISF